MGLPGRSSVGQGAVLHARRIDMAMSNVFLVRMPDPWFGAGERAKTTWSPAHGYCFQEDKKLHDVRVGDPFLSWVKSVENYSHLSLTFPFDKLPAIAGVANIVQKRTGSSYLAGLWRDDIFSDLQWRIGGN